MKLLSGIAVLVLSSTTVAALSELSGRDLSNLFNDDENQPKRDVTLTIAAAKSSFSPDEPVLIDIVLKNNEAHKPARILDWVVPCSAEGEAKYATSSEDETPTEMSFFDIQTTGGNQAKYVGAIFKRIKPKDDKDYKIFKPGDEISCTIDLSKYYEFAAGKDDNSYDIKYSVMSLELSNANSALLESLDSNTITVQVDARATPSRALHHQNLRRKLGITYTSCTTSRQNDLISARSAAISAGASAYKAITDVGTWGSASNCPRYSTWFGSYSSTRHNELKTGYSNTRNRLYDANIEFDCTCNQNYYAYVYPSRPYVIYLCNVFWSAPMTGTDSKMGTLIHEMSHFYVTAGTSDYAYGQANCKTLASRSPHLAVNNADSHEYIAENTPSLSCSKPPSGGGSCMSGSTRVETRNGEFMNVRDLKVGDIIQGLDKNMNQQECVVEAVGAYGDGEVYDGYTSDHFVLNPSREVVEPSGTSGAMETVDIYAVLTSCPLGLDESGRGFTGEDGDLFGNAPMKWSDYVVVHEALLNIVRHVGSFVFSPETYISMKKVKQYTNKFHRTLLKCANDSSKCEAFEKAAMDLAENALTEDAKTKVKASLVDLGEANKDGSISAIVSKGKSVSQK